MEQSGNKAELVARLKAALSEQQGSGQVNIEETAVLMTSAVAEEPGQDAVAVTSAEAGGLKPTEALPATNGASNSAATGNEKSRARIAFSDSEAAVRH